MSTRTIIDADGLVLGRMASVVAKRLLAGETIELVNAQNVVISGNKVKLVEEWKEFIKVGGFGGPRPPQETSRARPQDRPRMLPIGYRRAAAYKRLHVTSASQTSSGRRRTEAYQSATARTSTTDS
jgi:large subunit ribosomal protein L13